MVPGRYLIAGTLLCATLFGASVAASRAPAPKLSAAEELKAHDLKKLQGKWVVVREICSGTVQTGNRGNWVFKGDTVKVNDLIEGTFTIDPSTRPKQLTRSFTDSAGRPRKLAYIYTFDDDQLLLSGRVQFFNEDRPPIDFGSDMHFLRLER